MASVKTDNHNLPAKLELRRYFLRRYHADGEPIRVFDCCQGQGVIWQALRKEFEVASYWGADTKSKPGQLKIDSQRVLAQAGMTENVIDIDPYGNCWPMFFAAMSQLKQPTTIFLTRGGHSMQTMSREEKQAVGLTIEIPKAFFPKLRLLDFAIRSCLFSILESVKITEAVEAVSDGNARYLGCRLEPMKANGPQSLPASRPELKRTKKESAHV